MDAHPAVMILISLSVVAGVAGFIANIRADNYRRDFARWAARNFPQEWAHQPWATRKLIPNGALLALRRGGLQQDANFEQRYQELKRRERRIFYSAGVGIAFIAATAIGTKLFGWQW